METMFHNSTTIWHNPRSQQNFFKEKRLAYGVIWGSIKAAANTAWRVTGGVYRFGKKVTYPLRLPFHGAIYGIKKGAEYTNKGMKYVELGGRTGYEVGMGTFKTGIGGAAFEIAKAPVIALKRILIDNTRDVIQGIFRTPVEFTKNVFGTPFRAIKALFTAPYKFIKAPKETIVGMKNSVVGAVNSVRGKVGNALDNVLDFKLPDIFKGTRDAVSKVLKLPYRIIKAPLQPLLRTPYDVARNYALAGWEYPKGLYNSPAHFVKGYQRVRNSYSTAKAETEDPMRRHLTNLASSVRERIRAVREKFREEEQARLAKKGGGVMSMKQAPAGA